MCKSEVQGDGYNMQCFVKSSDHRTFLDGEYTLEKHS